MSSRRSFASLSVCLCAALLFAAGCWRAEDGAYAAAEVDEPEYRRAKELLKQGRTPEALVEFDKVLSRRGLNNAPETHMDMAIIYQQHMREPLSAIYHYQKYLATMPHVARPEAVRQRIDAAKREYASTLPGRPSLDAAGSATDYVETLNRLRAQNEQLRAALITAQASAGLATAGAAQRGGQPGRPAPAANPVVIATPDTPVSQNPRTVNPTVQSGAQPQNHAGEAARQQPPAQQQQQPARPAARRHVVRQGDTLYSISRQYYNGTATNTQVEAIVKANRDILESRNTPLRAGMELRIP